VLEGAIATLASGAGDATRFYDEVNARGGDVCQGDVLAYRSPLPGIDDRGDVSAAEEVEYWFVIGNSCDYNRPIDEVPWLQVVPLYELAPDTPLQRLRELRAYRLSRAFFLPAWPGADQAAAVGFFADLLKPTMMHRALVTRAAVTREKPPRRWWQRKSGEALPRARVVARLAQPAWFLLNAALVRFLARDDGRFD
jgi:hypothetical protein